jgi:hypothetical protein
MHGKLIKGCHSQFGGRPGGDDSFGEELEGGEWAQKARESERLASELLTHKAQADQQLSEARYEAHAGLSCRKTTCQKFDNKDRNKITRAQVLSTQRFF